MLQQHFCIFTNFNIFFQLSPGCFFTPHFNLLCAQLSIYICNLSFFFFKYFVLVLSLIPSASLCFSSNGILKLSIKVLLFFRFLSDVSGCLFFLHMCFTLPNLPPCVACHFLSAICYFPLCLT